MHVESSVIYVDLRLKSGDGDNTGAGVKALHEAHQSMLRDDWELAGSVDHQEQGTTIGAWLIFERERDLSERMDEIVAAMSIDERRELMQRAFEASGETPI